MESYKTIESIQSKLMEYRRKGLSIGFVPTMGALHEGHASLIKQSKNDNDLTVCSIFVNPIQFNNTNDLKNYPRNINNDIEMLESLGCDIVFHPEVKEIYPEEPEENWDFGHLEELMEGKYRPGHFKGVAIVVNRLFNIINPNRAYFGEKDYQQLLIIKRLVKHTKSPVEVKSCSTIREKDGLAMSSRNALLSEEQRNKAQAIYKALNKIASLKGEGKLSLLINETKEWLNSIDGFEVEYLQVADPDSLEEISDWHSDGNYICCVALFVGKIRLIDNLLF